MCPTKETTELLGRMQRGKTGSKASGSKGTVEDFCCDTGGPIAETVGSINEVEAIPVKITILHIKKESLIVETEEDPKKPWYIAHV